MSSNGFIRSITMSYLEWEKRRNDWKKIVKKHEEQEKNHGHDKVRRGIVKRMELLQAKRSTQFSVRDIMKLDSLERDRRINERLEYLRSLL